MYNCVYPRKVKTKWSKIKEENPDAELFLFMGDDMLLSFDRWYRFKDILSACTLVTACRTESRDKLQAMRAFARDVLGDNDGDKVIICESVPIETSSTLIRQALRSGESDSVSSEVMEYIRSRRLYRE